jgi:PAS domain S-box-containing protein
VKPRGAARRNSLRQRAEKIYHTRLAESGKTPHGGPGRTAEQLRVHQIELGLQNEELRRTQLELEASRNKYVELFDFAPVGYFLTDKNGLIAEVNQTGSRLLGVPRQALLQQPFSRFLSRGSADAFYRTLGQVLATHDGRVFTGTLLRSGGAPAEVLLEMTGESSAESGVPRCLLAVVEITELELEKQTLRIRQDKLGLLTGALLLAQEEGRRRIARGLHDELNQGLAAATIELDGLATQLPDAHQKARDSLRSISTRLAELADYVRDLAHQLKPAALEHLGLRPALETECAEFSRRIGIPVRYAHRGQLVDALPPQTAVVLFRVAQECLQNIGRHARAQHASVALLSTRDRVRLSLRDDGIGFDTRAAQSSGIGIMNMEESLRLVGGTLTVQSRPGHGTRVRAEVPWGRVCS